MNVLITGANGFLGSNLLEKFLKNNHNIYAPSVHNHNLKKFKNIQFDSMRLKDFHTINRYNNRLTADNRIFKRRE